MVIVSHAGGGAAVQAHPTGVALRLGLGQGLVGQGQQGLGRVAMAERRQADIGDRRNVTGAGRLQAEQSAFQVLRQLHRFFTHQPRRQHGELTATNTGDEVMGFRVRLALAQQLFANRLQQLVGALAAQALVEAGQVLDPQQQQVAGVGLFRVTDAGVELHLEITAVGEAGEVVLVGFGAQFFATLSLLLEQRLELFHHLVHGLYHATQFWRAGQVRQAEELAAGNGVGLFDHIVQRLQLPAQQQPTEHHADRTAQEQPAQATQGALPELGQGEHRMADHFYPCGLFPATADQRITTGRLQADQLDEPVGHAVVVGNTAALDDGFVGGQVHDADAGIVTAVEDRADQQLHHGWVIDIRGERQRQCRRGILGVGAQLVDVLGARAFQADHEAAAEGDHQEQTDCDQ